MEANHLTIFQKLLFHYSRYYTTKLFLRFWTENKIDFLIDKCLLKVYGFLKSNSKKIFGEEEKL